MDVKYIVDNLKQSRLVKQNVDLKVKCEDKPKHRTFISFKNFGITPTLLADALILFLSTLGTPEKCKAIFDQAQNVKITTQFVINCYDVRSKIIF